MDTRLKEILRNRGNEQQLATILAAVRASARRDEELLAAMVAPAAPAALAALAAAALEEANLP